MWVNNYLDNQEVIFQEEEKIILNRGIFTDTSIIFHFKTERRDI